jgi:hypothetical protein
MRKTGFFYAAILFAGVQACKSSDKPAETVVVTDTITQTPIVEVPAEVDTAAIIAYYVSQKAKTKGTPNPQSKQQGTKKVSVDSDPTFASTDVIPAPATATAPAEEVKAVHDAEMYYFIPDEMATFPGGEKAFDKYLINNLNYPPKALEAGVSRTIYPTLFLDEQGKPVDVTFRYEPTIYGFQDEARRILMNSPNWTPAKFGGVPVKSKFTIPISFKMQ